MEKKEILKDIEKRLKMSDPKKWKELSDNEKSQLVNKFYEIRDTDYKNLNFLLREHAQDRYQFRILFAGVLMGVLANPISTILFSFFPSNTLIQKILILVFFSSLLALLVWMANKLSAEALGDENVIDRLLKIVKQEPIYGTPIASKTNINITDERKAAEAVLLCINNAKNFLNAAKSLLDRKNFREAYLLGIYAGEEIGRVPLIFNYPVYSKNPTLLKDWKNRYNNHVEKLSFLRNLGRTHRKIMPTDIQPEDYQSKNHRLEIAYVSYTNSNFIPPKPVSENQVQEFIKSLDDTLLNLERRHTSVESVEDEINKMRDFPTTKEELVQILREKGFKDQ